MAKEILNVGKRGIKVADKDAIKAALLEVNGKASHYVADYQDVLDAAEAAESKLIQSGVTKKNLVGSTLVFSTPGPSTKAYKYPVAASMVTLFRATKEWRVSEIRRIYVRPMAGGGFALTVSQAARDDIQRNAFHGIAVAA